MKIGIGCLCSYRFKSLDSLCGGEYRYLLQMAEAFHQLGHEVEVFVEPAAGQPEFVDRGVKFVHYPNVAESKCDVIISQDNHFYYRHAKPSGARMILFTMGNPDNVDDFSEVAAAVTYNSEVPHWIDRYRSYQNTHFINPPISVLQDVDRDMFKIVVATTELYTYNQPHIAVEIVKRLHEIDDRYRLHYYHRSDWLLDSVTASHDEGERTYLRIMLDMFNNPTAGLVPCEFGPYQRFQHELTSAGFYLVVREGALIALTESEAMFHGTTCVRIDEVPYRRHFGEVVECTAAYIHHLNQSPESYAYLQTQGQIAMKDRQWDGFRNKLETMVCALV